MTKVKGQKKHGKISGASLFAKNGKGFTHNDLDGLKEVWSKTDWVYY